ncbi:Cytochrome P450 [Dillenia turbinata]|uniref:Cytochrome P450 n=1 Tax=Dillenia turbinata TaxID=194707 RepID=A0AAN8VAP1_9MAGN
MRSQGIKGPPYKFLYGSTKDIMNMKMDSTKNPMLEVSHNLFPRIQPDIYAWKKLYGNNFLAWYGPIPLLVVTDSKLMKEVFMEKAYARPKYLGPTKKLVGDGIIAAKGERWAKLRKLANQGLNGESLKGMIPAMVTSVEEMLERWRAHENNEIEVFEEFRVLASDIISRTAFRSSYLEAKRVFEILGNMTSIISKSQLKINLSIIGKLFKSRDDLELDKMEKEIKNIVSRLIKNREEKVKKGEANGFGSDYLGLLMEAHHDSDKTNNVTEEEMIDECKTLYIAGYETTRNFLTWTVLLLALHQEWQEKARKEVLELFGKNNPDPQAIGKMKTMTMVANESLRLYPPVDFVIREAESEVRLGDLVLPANTYLHLSSLVVHQNTQIWGEDAHLFKPDRFAEGVSKATNNNPAAFVPFGLGTRICAGLNFALAEAKVALSMILQRYALTLSPTYIHSPISRVTIQPQHGVQVILHPL